MGHTEYTLLLVLFFKCIPWGVLDKWTECYFISEVFAQEANGSQVEQKTSAQGQRMGELLRTSLHSPPDKALQVHRLQLISSSLLPGKLKISAIMQNQTAYFTNQRS